MIGNKQKKGLASSLTGFTLIEVIVSIAIFSVIILASTGIFKLVIDAQRKEISTQNVEESLKYFSEVTAKEIRAAQKSDGSTGSCGIPTGQIYVVTNNTLGDLLAFKNYYGDCVSYALQPDTANGRRFTVSRGSASGFISPGKIIMDSLHFYLTTGTSTQALVTTSLTAHAVSGPNNITTMTIQTSISSRYYK